MDNYSLAIALCLCMATALACSGTDESDSATEQAQTELVPADTAYYEARGRVRSVNPSKTFVIIRHDEIKSFMSAMTMPFPVSDSTLVDDIQSGDSVHFTLAIAGSNVAVTAINPISE